ncbi:MAG: hypothetical protein R2854_11545 [Caldilineaceae bacterium]
MTLAQRIEEAADAKPAPGTRHLRFPGGLCRSAALSRIPRLYRSNDVEEDPFADNPPRYRCNFAARMRESLRENAYLHDLRSQFAADALGSISAPTLSAPKRWC